MATKTINARIKVKSDTDEAFGKATFVPNDGEPVFYETSKRFKVGDGTTKIGDLPFVTLPLDDNIVDVGALDNDILYFSDGDINVGGAVDANSVSTGLVDTAAVQVREGSSTLNITPTTISSDSMVDITSGNNYVEVASDAILINGNINAMSSNLTTEGNISAQDITASSYITATKTITAENFITRGGTRSQFVRGDGGLETIPTSLKNPNALKLKNTSGTVITYDGSVAQDLSGGVYYALYSTTATNAINDLNGNKISDTYVKKSGDTMTGALVNNVSVQAPTFYIGGTSQYMQYNSTTGCVEIIC